MVLSITEIRSSPASPSLGGPVKTGLKRHGGRIPSNFMRGKRENDTIKVGGTEGLKFKGEKVVTQGETLIPYGVVSLKTPVPGSDSLIIQILKRFFG
jgi:hypothetical protein